MFEDYEVENLANGILKILKKLDSRISARRATWEKEMEESALHHLFSMSVHPKLPKDAPGNAKNGLR